jgi:uncharacterized protein (TIRG00374 family)
MKKKLIFCAKLITSVLLLCYLISLLDFDALLLQFSDIQYSLLCVAYIVLLCQVAISSLKWKIILNTDGVSTPYPFLFKTYLIGNFISLFLPSSFGGDIYRVIAVKSGSSNLSKSLSSVLFDRLSGLFALMSISLFAYMFVLDMSYSLQLLALYVLLISSFLIGSSDYVFRHVERNLPKRLSKLAKILASFNVYRKNPGTMIVVLLLSFFFKFNIVLINKIYCEALNIDISIAYLMMIIPLVYLTEALPISINGLGVRESAFVFFFVLLGHTKEEAMSVAILVVLMRYLVGLAGGTLLLTTLLPPTRSMVQKRPILDNTRKGSRSS